MNNLPDSIAYERVLYGNARSAFTSSASPHIIMGHSGSISPPIQSMIAVTLVFVTDVIGKAGKDNGSCRSFSCIDRLITKDSEISESFYDFFTEIGPKLAREVQAPTSGSFRDYLGPPSGPSAFFSVEKGGKTSS